LINYAARFTEPGGRLIATRIEPEATFERYLEVIAKIPAIDTGPAGEAIRKQLLKEAHDYIGSSREELQAAGVPRLAMIVTLALEETIHAKKSIIAGVFAVVCLFVGNLLGVIPGEATVRIGRETLRLPIYIPGVDWGVIAIILGSSLFVNVTSRSGLCTRIAIKLTKRSAGDPLLLLIY